MFNIFRKKQEEQSTEVIKERWAGDDLGYGREKGYAGPEQNNHFSYPAIVGEAVTDITRSFTQVINNREDLIKRLTIKKDGKLFCVGENARTNTKHGRISLKQDKAANEHNIVRFMTTLALMTDIEETHAAFNIVTGLPVEEWKSQKDALEKALKQEFVFDFYYGSKIVKKSLKVKSVHVMTQGEGAYYDFALTNEGRSNKEHRKIAKGRVIVLDPGYKTTDAVYMENGIFTDSNNGQLNQGISDLHKEVSRLIMEVHGIKKELHEMDEIVRKGKFKHGLKEIDIAEKLTKLNNESILSRASRAFAEDLAEWLHVITNDKLETIDAILLAGGGANIIFEYMKQLVGHKIHVILIEDPEFANARGYWKYAQLLKLASQTSN